MCSWANVALSFSCTRSLVPAVWLWVAGVSHKVTETLPRGSWGCWDVPWLGLQGSSTTQGTTLHPKPAQHHFCHSNFFVRHHSSCTGNPKFKHNSPAVSEIGSQALLKPLLPLSRGRHCNGTSPSACSPEQLKPMLPVSPGPPPNYSLFFLFRSFSKLWHQTQSLLLQKSLLLCFKSAA